MRRDDLYLNDIIEAVDHIAAFLAEPDFEAFLNSELVRSAVVQKLAVIGEAAAGISDKLRKRHPQIPWPQIVAFRNILIHAYFGIDWNEVWKAARVDCPVLRKRVADILAADTGEPTREGGAL
jgi:uncharacterized protein with HEPN domain